jgi:excinuclease ABC subunit B
LTDDLVEEYEQELALAEKKPVYAATADLPKAELSKMISELEKQMKQAAQQLEFEKAAMLRDQIMELRQLMVLKEAGKDSDLPAWERQRLLDEAGLEIDD